jgi:hypothetical protein
MTAGEILKYIVDNMGWYLLAAPFGVSGIYALLLAFETGLRRGYRPMADRVGLVWVGLFLLWITYCMVT